MQKEFYKSHLKTGMRVIFRNGIENIVFLNTEKGDVTNDKDGCFLDLKEHNNDLIRPSDREWDIMEVFSLNEEAGIGEFGRYVSLLWRRNENPIFTYKGVDWSETTLKSMIDKQIK